MCVLRVSNLKKAFGIRELYKDVSFELNRGTKAGLVGANGTGKTTLMRAILGLEESSGGSVRLPEAATIGYVEQQNSLSGGTLYEELAAAFADVVALGEKKRRLEENLTDDRLAEYERVVTQFEGLEGYDYESRLRRVAFGLGFTETDLQQSTAHFSGGQQTRVCLAKALIREPDFLFLDEPTNHLDIQMIEWLENFLANYQGGVLLISHDRFFLDRVVGRIIELENQAVTIYEGNYSYYRRVKAERRKALTAAYQKQQAYIQKTEEYIRRYRAGIKSKQARGRESQLKRLPRLVLPPEAASFQHFAFQPPSESAERVAELIDVTMSFGDHKLFAPLSLLIRRRDGVALVGANGTGKTTLLKIMVGELTPTAGEVKIGSRVKIGYFSQQHEGLNPENTLLDEITGEYGLEEVRARSYLGSFLFPGDDVYKRIGDLSGGEQARVAFLKLLLTGANFLVLDEPTNHLDIPAKEAVEEALLAFPGTFIVVSHDRYFLDKVTSTTLALEGGRLTEYLGNYSYYRERAAAEETPKVKAPAKESKKEAKQDSPRAAKATKPPKTGCGSEAQLERLEAMIAMAEAELKYLEREMNDPAIQSDLAESRRIADEYGQKEEEIARLYDEWELLAME